MLLRMRAEVAETPKETKQNVSALIQDEG